MKNYQTGEAATWFAGIVGAVIGFGAAVAYVHQNFISDDELANHIDNHPSGGAAIPSGVVAGFDLETCPTGWEDYEQAYGRFIRGIDKSENNIDPDGRRNPGGLQEDSFKEHDHARPQDVFDDGGALPSNVAAGDNLGYGHEEPPHSIPPRTGITGESETRPKNVALLFCEKV